MKRYFQTGIGLAGLITLLLAFAVIAFGAGWLAKNYYANHLFLIQNDAADFPEIIKLNASPVGLSWNGQQLVFSSHSPPLGVVRLTPLERNQYRKTAIALIDNDYLEQIQLQGITWNGSSYIALADGRQLHTEHEKVFVELDPETFQIIKIAGKAPDFTHCIAWDGINYWAGTYRSPATKDSPSSLYKMNADLQPVARYRGAGSSCTGLAWDGKFLWWVDETAATLYLYNIFNNSTSNPAIVHHYKLQIDQPAGISFDGRNIWLGDARNQALMRLNENLYFDWLGGHFDISGPETLSLIDWLAPRMSDGQNIDDLVRPLLNKEMQETDIIDYLATLHRRYSNDEIRQILNSALENSTQTPVKAILKQQLNKLVDTGKIDYKDSDAVAADAVKVVYFRGTVTDGNLLASWKIIAGAEILSGINADRPPQLPDAYDFTTFIRYTVRVVDLQSGNELEYDFDYFGEVDVQNDVILLEDIQPGEYSITIETVAQYYTDTQASRYQGKFEMNIFY